MILAAVECELTTRKFVEYRGLNGRGYYKRTIFHHISKYSICRFACPNLILTHVVLVDVLSQRRSERKNKLERDTIDPNALSHTHTLTHAHTAMLNVVAREYRKSDLCRAHTEALVRVAI